jgi:hypothetical protein
VPTWRSDQIGEKMMMKLPRQFEKLFADSKPLDEETGRALAQWAKGGAASNPPRDSAPAATAGSPAPPSVSEPAELSDAMVLANDTLAAAARKGTAALRTAWANLDQDEKRALVHGMDAHKATAALVDAKDGAEA